MSDGSYFALDDSLTACYVCKLVDGELIRPCECEFKYHLKCLIGKIIKLTKSPEQLNPYLKCKICSYEYIFNIRRDNYMECLMANYKINVVLPTILSFVLATITFAIAFNLIDNSHVKHYYYLTYLFFMFYCCFVNIYALKKYPYLNTNCLYRVYLVLTCVFTFGNYLASSTGDGSTYQLIYAGSSTVNLYVIVARVISERYKRYSAVLNLIELYSINDILPDEI